MEMAGRRNWLLMVGLIASGLLILSAESARAQGYAQSQSVKMRADALEKVQWYKAPKQIQILPAGPIVRDYRTGPEEPETYTIPIGPVGGAKGANGAGSTIPAGGNCVGSCAPTMRIP